MVQATSLWGAARGWLVGWLARVLPLEPGLAIASNRETTQSSFAALVDWAAAVSAVYLEGALDRAVSLAADVPAVITDLLNAEYEALTDAEQQATVAKVRQSG